MLIATKNRGFVETEAFKPLDVEAKAPAVKFDLMYKGGRFVIDEKFLQNQTEEQGWNVGFDSAGVYLLKSVAEETQKHIKFLSGEKPNRRFLGAALQSAITNANFPLESFDLISVDPSTLEGTPEGFEIWKVVPHGTQVTDVTTTQESLAFTQEQVEELSREPAVEELVVEPVDSLL